MRVDRRRGDAVDLDAVLRPGGGEAAGQPDRRRPWRWRTTVLVGSPSIPVDVVMHDAAVALLDHVRPRGAGGVERAADVHGEVARRGRRRRRRGSRAQRMMPALLTRMSMRPNRSTAASTSACAPAAVDTSLAVGDAAPPAATISAATVDARLGVGAVALHRAAEVVDDDAGAPRRRAAARRRAPMPRPAPVTTATRPSKRSSSQAATGAFEARGRRRGCRRGWPCARRRAHRRTARRSAPGCRGTCPRRAGSRCPTRCVDSPVMCRQAMATGSSWNCTWNWRCTYSLGISGYGHFSLRLEQLRHVGLVVGGPACRPSGRATSRRPGRCR